MRLYSFYLESISKEFTKVEQSETSFNGVVYTFQSTIAQLKKKI